MRELYTLRGDNIVRDGVPDHLHHHGLMYGITVNGNNFWEEKSGSGVEKPIELTSSTSGESRGGLPQARFTQVIHWLPNRAAADPLLIEQRTVTVTVDERNQEVAVRWDAAFEVGKTAGKVALQGASYHGLGMRFPQAFDHVARFENPADAPYPTNNTLTTIDAAWTSVAGAIDGREIAVLMCGLPGNAPGHATFFTMANAFAYLSATQGLEKAPLEYAAGDKFKLSYLVTVYAGAKPREFLQHRYERWEKERN